MKLRVLLLILIAAACKRTSAPIVKSSNGNINTITVVMPDLLWKTEVGQAVRAAFAFPAEGLPQQEPLFDLRQMPPEVFTGFARSSRAILWVGFSDEVVIRTDKDRYARPQQMAVLSAPETTSLVEMVLSQSTSIIKSFKQGEVAERQRRIGISTLKQDALRDRFGIDLTMPSAYRVFKEDDKTVWFQREIQKGHVNILVYELPKSTAFDWENPLQDVIRIRDSVGKAFVPGRLEGAHLITEEAYKPYVYYTKIGGLSAIETRGTWEVKGDFMAGPYLQYFLDDKANNRYLVMEGFAFAPSVAKRDYVFEAEAIMKSIQEIKFD
ncbi:MAG: DUF4837 domain-containing protein [Gammaproteobacteria bacterium]|nr:DUF4837 domain-containing protein [Gammaproteobacteria bacterium]